MNQVVPAATRRSHPRRLPEPTGAQVAVAMALAVLLHGALWLWFAAAPAPPVPLPLAASAGGTLRLALGSAATDAGNAPSPPPRADDSPMQPTPPDPSVPAEPVATPPPVNTEPEVKQPEPEPKPTPQPEPTPAARPEPETRQPAVKPPEPSGDSQAGPPDTAQQATAATTDRTAATTASNAPSPSGSAGVTGMPGGTLDAAVVNAQQRYLAELARWLERHKRYPRQARSRGIEGTTSVRFTLNRDGQLLAHQMVESSGFGVLDRAAESLLARASPFPEPPPEITDTFPLTLVVPVAYRLR
ncbi:MAG: TonB family protein [Pseudomonadota bacterium]|nr:TonB family protein [Pseudomonadota bacterium]